MLWLCLGKTCIKCKSPIDLLTIIKIDIVIIDFSIFLLTGLYIYTGEYKAQGPMLCSIKGRALRGPRALYLPIEIRKPVSRKFIA